MTDKVELYCTYDEDHEAWIVWFPHPLGGKNVLESFETEEEALRFWTDQIDNADFDPEK